jgi:hypothetical protein
MAAFSILRVISGSHPAYLVVVRDSVSAAFDPQTVKR